MLHRLLLLLVIALSVVVLEGCATASAASAPAKRGKKKRVKKRAKPPVIADASAAVEEELDEEELDDEELDAEELELTSIVVAEGGASFYHDALAGRRTANGEKYNPEAKTCAHKSLPFGTVVVVQDTVTGRATRCRINDRGPFVGGRIIDLSKRVARELGIIDKGVAQVRIRVIRHVGS